MMEIQAVNFPPSMAEFLNMIKERYGGSENPTVYKIVKIPARYDGSESVVCGTEIAWKYDDLCVKMFDLDVSGWEIWGEITCSPFTLLPSGIYNVVTIRMTRLV